MHWLHKHIDYKLLNKVLITSWSIFVLLRAIASLRTTNLGWFYSLDILKKAHRYPRVPCKRQCHYLRSGGSGVPPHADLEYQAHRSSASSCVFLQNHDYNYNCDWESTDVSEPLLYSSSYLHSGFVYCKQEKYWNDALVVDFDAVKMGQKALDSDTQTDYRLQAQAQRRAQKTWFHDEDSAFPFYSTITKIFNVI